VELPITEGAGELLQVHVRYSLFTMAFVVDLLLCVLLFLFSLLLIAVAVLQRLGVFYRLSHKVRVTDKTRQSARLFTVTPGDFHISSSFQLLTI